ncbi:CoA transferase [Roseomonas populi]|uniref:CoA transferase n=1 Tax=Roseomonas populi TaxID=3121582 RepID=A0ABT1XA37_9PROT|nr:CoA transferase [Roseomonas pecuniae]MCR0984970.1 CoA transferase [Roseomonas pecuniae]
MSSSSPLRAILSEAVASLSLPTILADRLTLAGEESLPSCFLVTDLAAAAIGAAGIAVSDLLGADGPALPVAVDRHLASAWFLSSLRPQGWNIPAPWDPIAGDYRAADGWIRLHTNASHHREAALSVLGCAGEREAVAAAVSRLAADDLEAAVLRAGGCAATMRDMLAWQAHPQGQAVRAEPLIALEETTAPPLSWRPDPTRPLAGIRVLDLTRILAGPVATRFLAGLGAAVLRIDPPGWEEPSLAPDVTPGKRCARLDLRQAEDRRRFEALLAGAHILVHGYRPGALDALGLGAAERRRINPGLIDVSLCAYGWTGPWAGRRGFDSLVQMSSGIAAAGMVWKGTSQPVPLPAQALDHATGYLMGAAALRGLTARLRNGRALTARLSLARTACTLTAVAGLAQGSDSTGRRDEDFAPETEETAWGPALRLRSPLLVGGTPLHWNCPASKLGSAEASWDGGMVE